MSHYSFTLSGRLSVWLVLFLLASVSLLTGCSQPSEEPPVNARVTDTGQPAPPEAANAPAAPGMETGGKGGKGKRGP